MPGVSEDFLDVVSRLLTASPSLFCSLAPDAGSPPRACFGAGAKPEQSIFVSFFLENYEMLGILRRCSFNAAGTTMRKAGLCKFEIEAADIFINLLMLIELQKYSGKVYGLLFVSPRHLRMEEVVDRLYLSKGAASEDLKLLRSLRVANAVYCPAVPRDHFAARTEQVQSGFDRLQGGSGANPAYGIAVRANGCC